MRGDAVTLYEKTQTGTDPLGAPVWGETPVTVENVLVGEPTSEEIAAATDLYGKRIRYMLGIPKGDAHDWTDSRIDWTDARGVTHRLRSFGFPIMGVEHLVPTAWHLKVRCEEIE